jgi:hypothetical protein
MGGGEDQNYEPEHPPEDADQQPEMRPAQLKHFASVSTMGRRPPPSLLTQTVCSHVAPRLLTRLRSATVPLAGCSGLILIQPSPCPLPTGRLQRRACAHSAQEEERMRFYNRQHYCGIDLHVKTMHVCILDAAGQVLVHRNVKSTPAAFLESVAPYQEDLVVAASACSRGIGSQTSAPRRFHL